MRIKCTNIHKTASQHARHTHLISGNLQVAFNVCEHNNMEVIDYFIKCHFVCVCAAIELELNKGIVTDIILVAIYYCYSYVIYIIKTLWP